MRVLESYGILDTARERAFDDIVALASALFQAPIAIVNFVGSDRQWFKAETGIGCNELPIDDSICRFAILEPGVFVVPDLASDHRFDCNPLIHVEDGLRFYAGALLESPEGMPLGTVCVLDRKPRPDGIADWQRDGLAALASQVMRLLTQHVTARHQTFLMDLTRRLQRETSARTLVDLSIDALGRHLDVAQVGFCKFDDDGDHLDVLAEWSDGRLTSVDGRWRLSDFSPALVEAIANDEVLHVEDVIDDVRTASAASQDAFARIHTRAFLNVPIVRDDNPVAMFFSNHPEPRFWAQHEVELIAEFARRVWVAFERAQAVEMAAERERALAASEAAARAAADELAELYDKAPMGLALLDRDLRFVRINSALAEMNGFSPEAHIGKTAWELLPDLRASAEAALNRVLAFGESLSDVRVAGTTAAQPGVLREWREHFYPQRNGAGEIIGIGIVCEEVTERAQLERRIRNNEAHLRRVLDQLFAFVGTLTPEGILTEANRAPIEAAGLKREDVIGKPFADAHWWAHDCAVQKRLRADIARAANGETVRYDVLVAMAHDSRTMIDFQLSPMRDDEGRITHLIASGVGIDDRLAAEAELRALNTTLEERVRDEAARREATQVALMQAQKMEALGQLTSGIAHDFNNVIQAISSGFNLIRRRSDDAMINEVAEHSIKAAERGRSVVDQLLAFARQQPIRMNVIDLCPLLVEAQPLLERTAGSAVSLAVDCPDDIGHVRTDPGLLEAALINLVGNARDAMPHGGSVVIKAHRGMEDQDCITIAIEDSGEGMSPEMIERVIEPFYTTKPVGKGTGMGLAMVHGFVEQCGGRLRIESEPGMGTRVSMDLPRAVRSHSTQEQPEALIATQKTVLLVDDDDSVRALAAIQLRELGYRIVEAGDGEEALSLFSQARDSGEPVDIILSDVRMPKLDGPAFVDRVRDFADVPVIFMTGFAEAHDLHGETVLKKPFAEEDLVSALKAYA